MSTSFLKSGYILVLLLVVVSCQEVSDGEEREEPGPTQPVLQISVNGLQNPTEMTVDVGDTIFISAVATAEAGIKTLRSFVATGGPMKVLLWTTLDSAVTKATLDSIPYAVNYTLSGKDATFLVTLGDKLNQADTASFKVHVNESPIASIENVTLGAYGHESIGNFYSVAEDTIFFPNNLRTSTSNRESVDFILSFDTEAKIAISSPDDPEAPEMWDRNMSVQWPFQSPNSTRFVPLDDSFDYEGIYTAAQLDEIFIGEEQTAISGLIQSQYIAFKLDQSQGGKIGVLEIIDIVGKTQTTRSINFNFIIQK